MSFHTQSRTDSFCDSVFAADAGLCAQGRDRGVCCLLYPFIFLLLHHSLLVQVSACQRTLAAVYHTQHLPGQRWSSGVRTCRLDC
jgi:hypothetical protein